MTIQFTPNVTVIPSAWLNPVDTAIFSGLGVVGGTANALTAVGPASVTGLIAGQRWYIIPAVNNTGAASIALISAGNPPIAFPATPIVKLGNISLLPNDLIAGVATELYYDGVNFQLLVPGTIVSAVPQIYPISITNGGTGVTTVPAAISALGLQERAFVNRIINGGFTINQRAYVTNTALAAGVYAHDRWKAGAGGGTYTFAQPAAGVPCAITITAGTIQQVIEGANLPEGGSYTLQWAGTAQARVNGGAYGASPLTVTGLAAGSNATVEFNAGTITGPVQFEARAVASPIDYRGYGLELYLCQRYFEIIYGGGQYGAALTGGVAFTCTNYASSTPPNCYVKYQVTKRATPTIGFPTAFGNVRYVSSAGVFTAQNPASYSVGVDGFDLSCSSAPVAGYGFMDTIGQIQISAEL